MDSYNSGICSSIYLHLQKNGIIFPNFSFLLGLSELHATTISLLNSLIVQNSF